MRSFSQVRRCRSCTPLASVNRDGDDDDNDILARRQYHNRRSFSYHKLPQQLLKLSVLKLDGSCFEVQISRTASVLQLKQAVEEVFRQSPKEGEDQISWSHVWGHFCLSYEGKKLINDKESLQTFGVMDGDQVEWIHGHGAFNSRCRGQVGRGLANLTCEDYEMSSGFPLACQDCNRLH